MRILVNYNPEEKEYLPILAGMLKKHDIQALATSDSHGITGLLSAAHKAEAEAIFLCNEQTLKSCVQTTAPAGATLANYRGSRLNFSIPAIVGSPLSHLHIVTYGKFLMERDISKFAFVKIPPTQLKFRVCETYLELEEATRTLGECLIISMDIETTTFQRITCISFTGLCQDARSTVTYVIPLIDFGLDHYEDEGMYAEAICAIQNICHNNVPKMMFNDTYDAQYLIAYGAEPRNLIIDTMGLQHSEFSELPKTLAFTTSINCYDYYYWKQESDIAYKNKDIRSYWGYCAKDSWWTLRCFLVMMKNYPAYALQNYKMLFKLTYPYLYCAFEGWAIDNDARAKSRAQAQVKVDAALKDLQTMTCNPNFNPGSPKQVGEFIYNVLGAKVIKRSKKTDLPATDEKILLKVTEQHPLLVIAVDAILSYRGEAKAISTYYDFIQFGGRALYSQSPFATETARSNSRQSNWMCLDEEGEISSYGLQIQNVPKYAKDMFIADEGYTLIEPDNSKSEAWCVAYLSICQGLKNRLGDKEKEFYKSLGTLFFGISYEEVTQDLRNKVLKRIVHASNYMLGVDTFILNTGSKQVLEGMKLLNWKGSNMQAFVKFLLEAYHKPFPEIRIGYVTTRREILRTNKLTSPLGYTRYFFGDIGNDHKILRGAVAHAPQNLSVTILNKGFWRCYQLCIKSEGRYRIKAQIHDSLPGQIRDDSIAYYKPLILEAMRQPVVIHGDTLTIPVDWKQGKTWKAMS